MILGRIPLPSQNCSLRQPRSQQPVSVRLVSVTISCPAPLTPNDYDLIGDDLSREVGAWPFNQTLPRCARPLPSGSPIYTRRLMEPGFGSRSVQPNPGRGLEVFRKWSFF